MKIICIGDSFTKGFGVKEKENWLYLLNESSPHSFINKGINGDTTGGMLARFQEDVVLEKPNSVLIIGGTNDFICGADPTVVQANIMALVHEAFHNGIIPLVGIVPQCVPADVRRDWAQFSSFHEVYRKHEQYHKWLLEFSKAFGVDFIDLYSEFPSKVAEPSTASYFIDGVHLTAEGHKIVCDILASHFK